MSTHRRLGFGLRFALFAIVSLAVVILLNRVIAGFQGGRFDLTEEHIYSVSEQSKEILSELRVPVQVNLYITPTDKMPTEWKTLEQDIVDKLQEFAVASNGKLSFAVYDPSSDPEMAQRLEEKGIVPFPVQSLSQDEFALKNIYSAIGISYLDKEEEIIPRVVPQTLANLEYELISRIYRLLRESPPKVALYAPTESVEPQIAQMLRQMGRPVPPNRDDYSALQQILTQEKYEVVRTEITQQNPIPEDADTLIVVDPRALNDRQLYEIGRRVAEGMNAIIAVQQRTFNYQPGRQSGQTFQVTPAPQNPNINRVLDAWGVNIGEDVLMDENHAILSMQSETTVGGFLRVPIQTPIELPIQILVEQKNMNRDLSISGQLASVLYLWGTRVLVDQTKVNELGLTQHGLMTSSDKSWLVPAPGEGAVTPLDFEPPAEYSGPHTLAVLLEGQFPDPFVDQERPEWPETPPDPNNPMAAQQNMPDTPETPLEPAPARVLVTGCARMWSNNGIQAESNGHFFLNSVDALTLGEKLIYIRSKSVAERQIEEVSPTWRLISKVLVTFLVPVVLAVFGIVRSVWRKREAERYRAGLAKRATA